MFEELEQRKTLACGTVRSNRSGLPKEICGLKERKVKKAQKGREFVQAERKCDMRDMA